MGIPYKIQKIMGIGLFFLLVTTLCSLRAEKFLINTARSQYSYLQSDQCNYDDTANAVICKTHGTFQNIKKVPRGQSVPGALLIGSFVDKQNKGNDLYALSPQQAVAQTQNMLNNIKDVAAVLFNPVEQGAAGTAPTPNPYALDSLNAKAVDALLGPQGLNVDPTLIQYYKNFYFYLEYVVRIDMAARLIALAIEQKLDWQTVIETQSWQDFMKLMQSKAGSWANLESMIYKTTVVPNWDNLKGIINASSWKDLIGTPFWKSFSGLTTASIKNSAFWQKYLKYSVARSFVQDQHLLLSIKEVEETIFKYIPNIEIAYYNPDFTSLRNASEMFRLSLLLTDAYRMRQLAPIDDWESFKVGQNNFDLLKINSAAQDFQKTGFYQIASLAEDNPTVVYNAVAHNKVPFDTSLFTQEPLLQEELLLLSMIKIIHGLTHYLFDSEHLENTMNILASKQVSQPVPSIFIYAPEDYLYLEDINHVHDSFKNVAAQPAKTSLTNKQDIAKKLLALTVKQQQPTQQPKNVEVQGFFNHLWDDVKNAGKKVWGDVKKVGTDAVSFANAAGEGIWAEAKSLGFGVAGVFLTGIDPNLAQKLLNDSKKLQNEVSKDIDQATKSLQNTVTDVEDAAKDSVDILAKAIEDICIGATFDQDEEICKSYAGAFEAEFDIVINIIASNIHQTIAIAGGVIKLTADGVKIMADSAADVMTGNFSDLGSDLVNDLKQIGADAAVAILAPLTYSFKYLMQDLQYALKYAQYFISILTRLFIDATTAITYAIGTIVQGFAQVFGVDIDPSEWAKTVDQTLSEHERVIGTAITTALLLATIPLTGGASIPMIAMIVGPQIFAGYGSYQADELATDQLQDEKDFVHDYQIFVQNNEVIYQQQQQQWANELDAKYKSELANQERGLGFYENFISTNFEAVQAQMASALGSYWTGLMTPDKDDFNLIPGDVGSIYGISTGVYELNPSQGFALYSAARNSFSQEIAVSPAIAYQQDDGVATKVETKNWFNQKEVALLSAPVSEVHVRFKPIYLLNSFYIGLYFGGQEINPAQLLKTQQAPLDMAHLAKMAVYKKEGSQSPVTFGVYEHEGKQGWLAQNVQAPPFKLDSWYNIKMQLNNTTLLVKVWVEPDQEPSSWQTYTVSPSPSQKTVGVISSGASIEYQFVKPTMEIVPNTSIRPADNRCTIPCNLAKPTFVPISNEKERESIAQSELEYLINPKIGIFALQATNKTDILKGHYIYTTKATNLVINNAVVNDYVILCTIAEYGGTPALVAGTIGQKPQEGASLISLITETIYNSDGSIIPLTLTNLFDTYIKQFGPLSTTLMNQLTAQRKAYMAQLMAFTFGPFKLQAADQKELMQHHYIYKMPLMDSKGAVVKDSSGKLVNDYYLITILDTNNPPSYLIQNGNPGISPSTVTAKKTQHYGIISLTTGNLYGSVNKTPLNTGFSPIILLKNFEQNFGAINASLKNDIVASHQVYLTFEQSSANTATPDTGKATHDTKPSDLGTKTDHKGTDSGVLTPLQPPADQSAQKRSDDAGGGDAIFGGP